MELEFYELNKEQLWSLRKEITLNSLFIWDYENSFGFNKHDICDFFDGYAEYLYELKKEENDGKDSHIYYIENDNEDNLWDYYSMIEDLSWVRIDE